MASLVSTEDRRTQPPPTEAARTSEAANIGQNLTKAPLSFSGGTDFEALTSLTSRSLAAIGQGGSKLPRLLESIPVHLWPQRFPRRLRPLIAQGPIRRVWKFWRPVSPVRLVLSLCSFFLPWLTVSRCACGCGVGKLSFKVDLYCSVFANLHRWSDHSCAGASTKKSCRYTPRDSHNHLSTSSHASPPWVA